MVCTGEGREGGYYCLGCRRIDRGSIPRGLNHPHRLRRLDRFGGCWGRGERERLNFGDVGGMLRKLLSELEGGVMERFGDGGLRGLYIVYYRFEIHLLLLMRVVVIF